MKYIPLEDNIQIPAIGLGTSNLGASEEEFSKILLKALELGYRLIDTAAGYKNEKTIGKVISYYGNREELFLSTKLDDDAHGYYEAKEAIEKALYLLNVDYIDLFMIHSPNSIRLKEFADTKGVRGAEYWKELNSEAWLAMEEYKRKGILRSIGVSNFFEHHLAALLENCAIKPCINQVKLFIGALSTQKKLMAFCKDNHILLEAHTPLARGNVNKSFLLQSLSEKYRRSVASIQLAYFSNRNIVSIPRASKAEHLLENIMSHEISIDEVDLQMIENERILEEWTKIKDPDTGLKYN